MAFRGTLAFGLGIIFLTFVGAPGVRAQVFSAARTYPSGGTMPKGVATGDFNGDGNIDFAVVNQDNTVGVRMGDGKGGSGSNQGVWVHDRWCGASPYPGLSLRFRIGPR
jgi:hypothetical protein